MSALKRVEEKLNRIVTVNKDNNDVLILTNKTAWRIGTGYDSKDAENIKERFIANLLTELVGCW